MCLRLSNLPKVCYKQYGTSQRRTTMYGSALIYIAFCSRRACLKDSSGEWRHGRLVHAASSASTRPEKGEPVRSAAKNLETNKLDPRRLQLEPETEGFIAAQASLHDCSISVSSLSIYDMLPFGTFSEFVCFLAEVGVMLPQIDSRRQQEMQLTPGMCTAMLQECYFSALECTAYSSASAG